MSSQRQPETWAMEPSEVGEIVVTRNCLDALGGNVARVTELLERHFRGDWGDIDLEDAGLNNLALLTGARLLSVYREPDATVWVITDAADAWGRRHATTVLLNSDY